MSPGRRRAALALTLAVLALAACARKKPRVSAPAPAPQVFVGATEEGMASWYGHPYHGRPTTSGEIYDMEKLTAAHRTLPFGAHVQVTNLQNGRAVEVRINDRGPFVEDRVIDLSRAAARQIAMLGPGTARVRLRVVALPEAPAPGFFAVQVGAFRNRDNAERLRADLARRYGVAFIQKYDGPQGLFYRVRVGRESDVPAAQALAGELRRQNFTPLVVRVDENAASDPL
ncbi:MAG TPA: septal ring lytic transglycosylase RlpA family protein [Bryobacterales bacterium]|nr:septal ring lytic transglycosylase RlpA family protein [Bryobacterales bacterium]